VQEDSARSPAAAVPAGHPARTDVVVTGGGAAGSRFRTLEDLLEQAASASPSHRPDQPTAARLAAAAAQEAWQEAGGEALLRAQATVGVVIGSSRSLPGSHRDQAPGKRPAVRDLVYSTAGSLAGEVGRLLRTNGPCLAVSSACASGASALALAADLIVAGSCDAVVAGGVDAASHPDTVHLFARNGLTAPAGTARAARPFDPDSPGIVLADGAGFLVLERAGLRTREVSGNTVRLSGWSQAATPGDRCGLRVAQTLLEPCLRRALAAAGIGPRDLAFVSAHANGNPVSDAAERDALRRILATTPKPIPLVTSKHRTGHCLGGSPAIEAAVAVRHLRLGRLPRAEVCLPDFTPATGGEPLPAPAHGSVHAFGLWGGCAALVFSSQPPA